MPSDAVLFGVNQHTLILQLDYVVFQDERVAQVVGGHPTAQLVTPRRLPGAIWSGVCPDFGFSGMDAVWIADFMGCDPIYVAGIDCYSGDRPYWHSLTPGSPLTGARDPVAEWFKVRDYMAHPERVRVFGGPLERVFACA